MTSPYWRLEDPDRGGGPLRMIRRLPTTARPVIDIIWRAGRRQALVVLLLLIVAGVATAMNSGSAPSPEEVTAGTVQGDRECSRLMPMRAEGIYCTFSSNIANDTF